MSPPCRRPVRASVDAYTAGVNGFLKTRRGALPPEFYLLWESPAPWTAADSLRWGRLMALELTGNWRSELLRRRLADLLSPERAAELFPPYPESAPISIDGPPPPWPGPPLERRSGLAPPPDSADGSNAWAVAGSRTTTGKPILANDPHLGLGAPIQWYLVRLDLPGLTLAGASAPGVPFLVLGHNGKVAWGLTTTHGDASDLIEEEPAAQIETRNEVIRVRFGDDREIAVRRTRHGPLVSDIYPDGSGVVALASTALVEGDVSAAALYGANRADSVAAFSEALRAFRAPQQNVMMADRGGTIALDMPGLIPLRQGGEWSGFVPFELRPQTRDPQRGWIVNANNKLVPDDWPYPVAHNWPDGYRAQRIVQVLTATEKQSLQDVAALQNDPVGLGAGAALEALLTADAASERARRAMSMLRDWDLRMDRSRPEPLIYAAWAREAMRAVYADELGPLFASWWQDRPRVLQETAREHPAWCDDTGTAARETCPQQLGRALEAALDRLERDYGKDPATWRWGDAHKARFDNAIFGRIPLLRELTRLQIETDGGNDTVNRASMASGREGAPFENIHGPGYRAVYDLADLDRSLFIQAVGQSGNPLSPHYADLMPLWRDGKYVRLVPPEKPAHTLRLEPVETR